MKKGCFLIVCILLLCLDLLAEGGVIVVKGGKGDACIYNAMRGRGQKKFKASGEGKEQKFIVPEGQCEGLLYLISGGNSSWIRVKEGETVNVDVSESPWKFSGAGRDVNRYLYNWTQDFWRIRPNVLIGRLQMMMFEIPNEKKGWMSPEELFTAEHMAWARDWEQNALAALKKVGLKDTAFVAEQKDRIHYSWLELQCDSYLAGKGETDIPKEAMEFVRNLRFEEEKLLRFPGYERILSGYFGMADELGLIHFSATDFLQKRAARIGNPKVREVYILGELSYIFDTYNIYYQGDRLLASIDDMVISAEGKETWQKYMDKYQTWAASDENQAGKEVTYFNFENCNGKMVDPSMFRGKYLLIDVWATWCGPCEYQIPFLKKIAEEMKGRDIAFLSVSTDKPKDKEKWKAALKQHGLEDHGVIAPNAFDHEFFENYGIGTIPRFILVDPDGKVVMERGRRPSDIVLKKQLEELLDEYDRKKVRVLGEVDLKDGGYVNWTKLGMVSKVVGKTRIKDGKFSMTAEISEAGLYSFGCGEAFYGEIWMEPGQEIKLTIKDGVRFSGGKVEFNNLMVQLIQKYKTGFKVKDDLYDRTRGRQLREMYDRLASDIVASDLSDREKQIMKGYWQGYLLNQMYGSLFRAKVYGKEFKAPEVKKGYSSALQDLEFVPELVYYNGWNDCLQEFLYARMEAGKIKIHSKDSWLADLAGSIKNEELRESYIMRVLYLDILRGLVQGIEARIESVRPWVKKAENKQLLDAMPEQIEKERQLCAGAIPGTDLSANEFEDAKGQMVSFGNFKGKYVFIDLWATGCNPCVSEIPYIQEMEHRFAGMPIVWVSLSLDSKKQVWLDFMEKNNMKGVQLLCTKGFKHPFIQQIGLSGIPRFMLLDKEGKVLDINTLRPSNPVLGELLRLLLVGK